jgi:hypothetical protein
MEIFKSHFQIYAYRALSSHSFLKFGFFQMASFGLSTPTRATMSRDKDQSDSVNRLRRYASKGWDRRSPANTAISTGIGPKE